MQQQPSPLYIISCRVVQEGGLVSFVQPTRKRMFREREIGKERDREKKKPQRLASSFFFPYMNRSKARGLRRQPWSCARINACFLIARGIFKKKEEREREGGNYTALEPGKKITSCQALPRICYTEMHVYSQLQKKKRRRPATNCTRARFLFLILLPPSRLSLSLSIFLTFPEQPANETLVCFFFSISTISLDITSIRLLVIRDQLNVCVTVRRCARAGCTYNNEPSNLYKKGGKKRRRSPKAESNIVCVRRCRLYGQYDWCCAVL